jgi:DNA-binding NtrC family response regulator
MRKLFGRLEQLETSLVSVLIEGASGTGKELAARAIHERSSVGAGPFVAVNCAALDRALARSELFGHRRGAFTGAIQDREGAFEAASGGTLFLDELGELPLEVQPVLLRALEVGALTRLGENRERPVNVRIIAATNRCLADEARVGSFRQDLYFRLVVAHVYVPSLEERRDDIGVLAAHFGRELGIRQLPASVLAELCSRSWPGNARELRNAIQAYSVFGDLPRPSPACNTELETLLEEHLRRWVHLDLPYASQKDRLLECFLRIYVEGVLTRTHGNKSVAARLSGLERSYFTKLVNQLKSAGA